MNSKARLGLLGLTLSVSALVACGSSDPAATTGSSSTTTTTGGTGGSGVGGSGVGGATAGTNIKAADGGTVTADGVTADIPPGALAADTTITVDVTDGAGEPDAASILSKVYDFGPNATKFSKPVKLTIDFDAAKLPAGKSAGIAYLDAGKWVPLADSATAGAKVTATTMHFTKFTVVIVGAPGGGCAALPFAACGGDPSGTWTWSDACVDVTSNPYGATCPGASFVLTLDITGTLALDPAKTFALDTTTSLSTEIIIPKSCPGVAADCTGLDDKVPFVDTGAACKQTKVGAPTTASSTGTWATAGTTLTLTNADQTTQATPYCVEGNSLLLQSTMTGGLTGTVTYKLTK